MGNIKLEIEDISQNNVPIFSQFCRPKNQELPSFYIKILNVFGIICYIFDDVNIPKCAETVEGCG